MQDTDPIPRITVSPPSPAAMEDEDPALSDDDSITRLDNEVREEEEFLANTLELLRLSRPVPVKLVLKFRYVSPQHSHLTIQSLIDEESITTQTTPEELIERIDVLCEQARFDRKQFKIYPELGAEDISTRATVRNGNGGDGYLGDGEGLGRFERVGDMLFDYDDGKGKGKGKGKVMEVAVEVDEVGRVEAEREEVEGKEERRAILHDDDDDDDGAGGGERRRPSLCEYHRIATIPMHPQHPTTTAAATSHLPPMTWAILQNLTPTDVSSPEILRVPERKIHPDPLPSIGSLHDASQIAFGSAEEVTLNNHQILTSSRHPIYGGEMMEFEDQYREERYKGLKDEEIARKMTENLERFAEGNAEEDGGDWGEVPELPKMSFRRPFWLRKFAATTTTTTTTDVDGEECTTAAVTVVEREIWLAVRMVPHRLFRRSDISTFPVPADIIIRTDVSTSGIAAIRKGLVERLQAFCLEHHQKEDGGKKGEDLSETMKLFEPGVRGNWYFDLWIQPRRMDEDEGEGEGEGKGKESFERLVRMEGGDLVGMFVDEKVVEEEGGKGVVLYMEAHLVE